MKYLWIFLAIILFLMIQYQVELKRKEQKLRRKIRAEWGTFSDRRFTSEELEMIASYHRHCSSGFTIDDITWHDTAMDEVFIALNRTYSSVGEEYLYHALRTPSFSEQELKERSRIADLFAAKEKEREDIAFCLSRIGKNYRIPFTEYVLRLMELKPQSNLFHIAVILAIAASIVLTLTAPSFGILLLAGTMIFSLVTYFQKKGEVEPYFICIQKILLLAEAGGRISAIDLPELKEIREELAKLTRTLRRKTFLIGLMQNGSSMGGSFIDLLMDYVRMATHVDLIVFNRILREFKAHEKEIFRLIELIGCLELGLATASLREALPVWCEPELGAEKPFLEARELYHPLISEPVPNTIRTENHVLLTGSNASGKSTFLKTVAINSILAQTLSVAAAAYWRSSWFRVYSSMALADNLFEGESYFIVEIKSLKRIMDSMSPDNYPVLCFIDEVLRGTNTVERVAASAQILNSFVGRHALCFAATHDIELTALLSDGYDNYHFTEEVLENDVRFPYQLMNGPARSRNAIRLLGVMGYDSALIKKAEETAGRFMETGRWSL